ncbi:hypothetical protein DRJ16_07010 [Candidatus Woesearchaeota archaeon]|nr:MAG: hypothetical protein DRJ16_07010 [Candidatus Woesearchaeota archaeon]
MDERECKNCFTCQNCFSCQGRCYTCEVNYGGSVDKTSDSDKQEKDEKYEVVFEEVEYSNINEAIYDALDRIAVQLERQNKLIEILINELRNKRCNHNRGNEKPKNARRSVTKRKLSKPEDDLRNVPSGVILKRKKKLEM